MAVSVRPMRANTAADCIAVAPAVATSHETGWRPGVSTAPSTRRPEFDELPAALALSYSRAVALGRRAPTRPRDTRPDGDMGSSR